jgi:hypothetical protein
VNVAVVAAPATVETLPPYLTRVNGRLTLTLHATHVQTFKVCPLKYQLRYGWNIEKAVARASLNYGGAIHEALAYRFAHNDTPLPAVEEAQMALLEKWFAASNQPDDEWRNVGRAQQSIRAYNAQYPAHDWTVRAVEESFTRKVGEINDVGEVGGAVDVILEGRKDLVVKWGAGLWVVDHKTASDWGDDLDKNQQLLGDRRSFQFRAYAWEERERQRGWCGERQEPRDTLPVKGVVGNYIIGRKRFSEAPGAASRRTASAKPRDEFQQHVFTFDDATLREWRDECLLVAERILTSWRRSTWEMSFDRGCSDYGKCEYYDYCEESPATREALLSSSQFRQRDVAVTVVGTEVES